MGYKIFLLFSSVIILASFTCFNQQDKSNKHQKKDNLDAGHFKDIDWTAYDPASTIPLDKISSEDMQGLWKAYKGVFVFNSVVNAMNLTQPFIVEFKNSALRRNATDTLHTFIIESNLIISINKAKKDTGFINQITSTDLAISWKKGNNYTRYYYKK